MQKTKIEKLVQDVERKKVKLIEKDVVIEGLKFEVEKLGLKIKGLEKYKGIQSPVYTPIAKKEAKESLGIQQGILSVQINLENSFQK